MPSDAPKIRICVIEDDPDVLMLTRTILEKRANAEVLPLEDAQHALKVIAEFEPDLVLTDIEMPGVNGLELLASIRQHYPHLPVAIMTAHASFDYSVTALRSHADEFLRKPVPAAELVQVAIKLATKGRAAREALKPQVVLAIGAHPDDVEIGAGGILSAHRSAGDKVVILTMSRGARGGNTESREQESASAAELIGATLILEDLEDTHISGADPTVGIIERVIDQVSPTIIYTHSSNDRHQDHRAVNAAVLIAARSVQTLCCFQSPSATVDYRPTKFVSIDGFTATKLSLLACFASQASKRIYMAPDLVLATARYWSRFGTGTYVEPLEVIRDAVAISHADVTHYSDDTAAPPTPHKMIGHPL